MTAPSSSDKVVNLGARSNTVRREANPVLAVIRTRALRRFQELVSDVMGKADDALFDFVQRADGSAGNQDYFDAMRELRKQRPDVERRYLEHFTAAFSALEKGNPLEIDLERSISESQELSLVSEDQLEEQLGTSMIASSLTRVLGTIVSQLNYRIGIVAGIEELEDIANPIAPPHIAYAFRHALQSCDISIRIKVLLFKLYEREMATGLGGFYNETNRTLVEAGIAPEIKPAYARMPRVKRSPKSPAESGQAYDDNEDMSAGHGGDEYYGTPGEGRGRPRYVPVPETAAEQSIFASLHQLLSSYRQVQGAPSVAAPAGQGDASAPQMSAAEVLSVLSHFQNEMPASLREAVSNPTSISITQRLKQELLKGAERLGMDPSSRMTPSDEDSIDLVGMLFDILLDERDFDIGARQLIGRLIVPFIKVAMLDRRMFLQKTHPARRLLNALAEACEGNTSRAPQERELMARAETTIDRLVAEFNEDIAIFETLEQEFREFIEQHRRRAALAERRAAEAQRGKERLDHARLMSMNSLRQVLEDNPDLPPAIEAFLRRYWTHHLTLSALREESDGGDKHAQAVETGVNLAAMAQLESADERKKQFDALRPQIVPILNSAGCTGSAAEEVLGSLQRTLLVAEEAESAPEVEAETVTTLERNAPAVEPLPEVPEADEAAEEDHAAGLDYDEADAERIRQLEVGSWIQFTEEDGTTVPTKLSWVSPISNRMLFVNRRGLRYCVASPEELAAMMRKGQVNIRPNDAAFEYAMSQVLGKLRSGTGSAPR